MGIVRIGKKDTTPAIDESRGNHTSGFFTKPLDPDPGDGLPVAGDPPRQPHAYKIAAKMPAEKEQKISDRSQDLLP